jgi:hypothetical protein
MSWQLDTICMPPKKFDKKIRRVYERALPFLGVNCKIRREWTTLPETYQGLGMAIMPLISLLEKILFLLGDLGFLGQAPSNALSMAYKKNSIKVGLYGTPMQSSYNDFGHLSTDGTWFQNLWLLVSVYEVNITFLTEDVIQRIRDNNLLLVSEFFWIGYRGKQLASLNIVCCFQNLLHVSDITRCNGLSLDNFVISNMTEKPMQYTFPLEELKPSNFNLLKEAVARLCAGTTCLPYTLGPFLHDPHLPGQWFTTISSEALYLIGDNRTHPTYDVYLLVLAGWKPDMVRNTTGPHARREPIPVFTLQASR